MCARYTQIKDLRAILDQVQCRGALPEWLPRYNIAPGQTAPVIVQAETGPELRLMQWGVALNWAEERRVHGKLINARAESVQNSPYFRASFLTRRCLVPADGFYEWEDAPQGRRPIWFSLQDERPFCFAGLWKVWQPRPSPQGELFAEPSPAEGGRSVESFVIITTSANDLVRAIHHRMPVILEEYQWRRWLAPTTYTAELKDYLQPLPAMWMKARRASRRVNRVSEEGPACLEADEESG